MAYSFIRKKRLNGDLKRRWARCRTAQPVKQNVSRNYFIIQQLSREKNKRGTIVRLARQFNISRQRIREIYDLYRDRDEGDWLSVPALPGSELKVKAQIN